MNPSSLTQAMGLVPAVRPIRQDKGGTESGPTPTPSFDPASIQQCLERRHLVAVSCAQQEGQRPSPAITFQMDLRSKAPLRATERLVAVPLFAPAAL